MPDRVAVIVYSGQPQAVNTGLNLLAVAVAMEAEAHVYFTGDGVVWVGRPSDGDPSGAAEVRGEVSRRLRELKEDGTLHVYACTRAMKDHDILPENLVPEVDMPAGFAYFFEVASGAILTLSF
jgi:peroxiredoxin family protein